MAKRICALLPHEIIKKKDHASAPCPAPPIRRPPFPLLPHEFDTSKKDPAVSPRSFYQEFHQGPLSLCICVSLSPITSDDTNEKPAISSWFFVDDRTKVIIPSAFEGYGYVFPCGLTGKPVRLTHWSSACMPTESCTAARFMIPPDFPMTCQHRGYFVSETDKYINGVMEAVAEDKYHVTVYGKALVERTVVYEESIKIAKEIAGVVPGGRSGWRRRNTEGVNNCNSTCAVCFEEVEMSWFEGVKLRCSHEFHLRCIAPWLAKKESCPLCRAAMSS